MRQVGVSPDRGRRSPQLRASIRRFGILSELVVCQHGQNHYFIIDGARRHRVAQELGLQKLWCTVLPPMSSGERERLRFELYMTFKPLTQAEQARQRRRLRELGVAPPEV